MTPIEIHGAIHIEYENNELRRLCLGSFTICKPPRLVYGPCAWEQRKLGEIADRYDNLRVPITASERVAGSTPYYGANGIQDYVDGYTHEGEFILVAEDGATDLKDYPVQLVSGRIWVNNHAHVLQGKAKIAKNNYLKYSISQTDIEPFLVGGTRAKLNADTMMKIVLYIPKNIDEQNQIGQLFANLDHLITLHQREFMCKLRNNDISSTQTTTSSLIQRPDVPIRE